MSAPEAAAPVRLAIEDGVATVTLDRPEARNAISSALATELAEAFEPLSTNREVRAVVLTGAGERAFCAGADLRERGGFDDHGWFVQREIFRRAFGAVRRCPLPTVAAVFGYALGGGFELALCCDVLVASERASFGLPEGLLGLSPGGGGTQRLTRAAGPFVAADVLLAGRRLTATEALGLGLVAEVVAPERLLEAALAKAEQAARVAPLAGRAMLALVRTALEAPLEEGLTREQDALAALHRTRDAAEGIRAFVEKRAPRFTGE
jgi:enoyl-CoA hydratase/carnithine racemase